jgi:WhiB family transcriptional regulator, redox-sensing transcriptional regulator
MASITRLPAPVAENWSWQRLGSCRGLDSSVFFHPEYERGNAKLRREERAKAICRRCPVLVECRRHALSVAEPYGVWGGMTAEERQRVPS